MTNQSVKDFLDAGGTIRVCDPYTKIDVLPVRRVRRHRLYDRDICAPCKNRGICDGYTPCEPLRWVNGNTALREKLLDEPVDDHFEMADYNAVLAELSQGYTPETMLETIIGIRNYRLRIILAGLAVGIPRNSIAAILSISPQRICQILRRTIKSTQTLPDTEK